MIIAKTGLQIEITPEQLRLAREALESLRANVSDRIFMDRAKVALEALPKYYHAWLVDDGENQWWYAAETERDVREWFSNPITTPMKAPVHSHSVVIVPLEPREMLVVRDNQHAVGPMNRPAEDWANDQGKPYVIASTIAEPVTFGQPGPDVELETLVVESPTNEDGPKPYTPYVRADCPFNYCDGKDGEPCKTNNQCRHRHHHHHHK